MYHPYAPPSRRLNAAAHAGLAVRHLVVLEAGTIITVATGAHASWTNVGLPIGTYITPAVAGGRITDVTITAGAVAAYEG